MKFNGEMRGILIPIVSAFVSALIGAGIVYGVVTTKIDNLTKQADKSDEVIFQINNRLSFIEGALSITKRPFKNKPLGIQNK